MTLATADALIEQRRCGSCRFATLSAAGLHCECPEVLVGKVSGRDRCECHQFRDEGREKAWYGLLSAALDREEEQTR